MFTSTLSYGKINHHLDKTQFIGQLYNREIYKFHLDNARGVKQGQVTLTWDEDYNAFALPKVRMDKDKFIWVFEEGLRASTITFSDFSKIPDIEHQVTHEPPQSIRENPKFYQIVDMHDSIKNFLDNPTHDLLIRFYKACPSISLITKLRLFPTSDVCRNIHSLYHQIRIYLSPQSHRFLTQMGQEISGEGFEPHCFEGDGDLLDLPNVDFVINHPFYGKMLVDSTSVTNKLESYEKLSALMNQLNQSPETPFKNCLIGVCHHTYWEGKTHYILNVNLPNNFSTTKDLITCFEGKDRQWKQDFKDAVDSTLVKNMREVVPPEPIVIHPAIVSEAIQVYRDKHDLKSRYAFVKTHSKVFENLGYPSLGDCIAGMRISPDLKNSIRYSDAYSLGDLSSSKTYLKSVLEQFSKEDLFLKIMLMSADVAQNECCRVMEDFSIKTCEPTELNKSAEEASFYGDTIAYFRKTTEGGLLDGPLTTQIIIKPDAALSGLSHYARAAFYPTLRGEYRDERRATSVDVDDIENEIFSEIGYLNTTIEENELSMYERKKILLNMSPDCVASTHQAVLDKFKDTGLGGSLTHQYEIGNMVMSSIKNSPPNSFTLVRNGNLASFSFIKNCGGGSSFTNCPLRVFWHGSSNVKIRHPGTQVRVAEKGYLRSTKWHSVDARVLRWYVDQTVAVESRLATVESIEPNLMVNLGRISHCTFPNTQDFSQSSGLFKNMIDCLESIDATPQGIIEKSEGLVFNLYYEVWYYLYMLTTFYTGLIIREARQFKQEHGLRDHATGATAISFPDFEAVTMHPEIVTNFQNSFHMLIKFKTNKTSAEARDWLGVVKEKEIYENKVKSKSSKFFGWDESDILFLTGDTRDMSHVVKSIKESWAISGQGKKGSRYSWNIFFVLRCLLHERDMNGDRSRKSDEDFWNRLFTTPLDEYLVATGSMTSSEMDYGLSQSRRKSTSVYELIWMYEHNTTTPPMTIKTEIRSLITKYGDTNVTVGHLIFFLVTRPLPPCQIRLLDKDQVEGNREISALDVITMMLTSLHEKEWAEFSKRHPIDCIMSGDKSHDMRRMLKEVGNPVIHKEVLVEDNKDCSRYGPNVDLICMSLHSQFIFKGLVGDIMSLAENQMFRKHYKPPESLAKSYKAITFSRAGLVTKDGDYNKAIQSIHKWCPNGGLSMEGGMGQGILGVGASCNTSIAVQYSNYLYKLANENVVQSSSMVTSDDGHDTHRLKSLGVLKTVKWLSICRIKLMSMANNIINTAKSGLNFNNKSMNSIRMFRRSDGVMIETTPFFKFITSKVSLPESLSYLEDCIKANIVGADLCKMSIPADIAIVNTVHSLFLCCTLHKKWKLMHSIEYFTVPSILGGPVGPCIIESMVSPLATVAVFNGMAFESTESDMRILSQAILKPALSAELEKDLRETDFHSEVSLVKKSVDGLRFSRKVSKTDRRAFTELFNKKFTPGGIPNLLYSKSPVNLRDTTSTFLYKLSQGTTKESVPNNKYLMTWGSYRKSYGKKNINVSEGSALSFLIKNPVVSTEELDNIFLQLTPRMMQDSLSSAAKSRSSFRQVYQGNDKMHNVVDNLLVSKLMLCRKVREELIECEVKRQFDPQDRLMTLEPHTSARLRPKRDIQNLEQEVKRSVFLDLTGNVGAKYIRDTFGKQASSNKGSSMSLSSAMQVADNISTNIVDFLTLRERTVKIKSTMNFSDDRSFIIEFMRHNMSFNKEFAVSKDEIMNIVTYPLRDFLSQVWSSGVVDDAIELNNYSCVEDLFYVTKPPPRFVQTDREVKTKDDLIGVTTTDSLMERYGTVACDTYNSSNVQLIRLCHQLKMHLRLTREFIESSLREIAKPLELSGKGTLWVNTNPLQIIMLKDGVYNHELFEQPPDKNYRFPEKDAVHYEFIPHTVVATETFEEGPLICIQIHENPIPVSKMLMIDPSPSMIRSDILHELPNKSSHTKSQLQSSLMSEDDTSKDASLQWIANEFELERTPCEVYLSLLGKHNKSKRSLFLSTDEVFEKFVNIEVVDFFISNVNCLDVTLKPLTRVVINSLQKQRKRELKEETVVSLLMPGTGKHYDLNLLEPSSELDTRLTPPTKRKEHTDSDDDEGFFLDLIVTQEEREEMKKEFKDLL